MVVRVSVDVDECVLVCVSVVSDNHRYQHNVWTQCVSVCVCVSVSDDHIIYYLWHMNQIFYVYVYVFEIEL